MAARPLPLAMAALGASALVGLALARRPGHPPAVVAIPGARSASPEPPPPGAPPAGISSAPAGETPAAAASASPSAPGSVASPAAPGVVRAGPPSMLHLDPHHTNRSPYLAPRAPHLAWTHDTGGPVAAAPVVAFGLLIVASLSGKLSALGEDGTARWTVDLGDRIYGSPLLMGERLWVGVDRGHLVSLDARTGKIGGRLDVDGDADTAPVPLPGGGLAFAAGRVLYGLRPDGAVRFRWKARRKIYSSPAAADDGALFFGGQDESATCLEPSGALRFRVPLGADADAAPALGDDGTAYFGTDDGQVVALAPRDGAVLWRARLGGFVRGPLSVRRDGAVLAATYGPVPAVVALDPAAGRELFRFSIRGTGAPEFGIHGAPLEDAAGALVFGAQDDALYALDPRGALLWRVAVGGDVDAAVILASDGVLYAGSDDGKIYAFRDARPPLRAPLVTKRSAITEPTPPAGRAAPGRSLGF